MSKIVSLPVLGFTLSVLAAAIASPAVAKSDGPSPVPRYGVETTAPEAYMPLVEGRNAAVNGRTVEGRNIPSGTPTTQGVEPYIANQIEQNARSN